MPLPEKWKTFTEGVALNEMQKWMDTQIQNQMEEQMDNILIRRYAKMNEEISQ